MFKIINKGNNWKAECYLLEAERGKYLNAWKMEMIKLIKAVPIWWNVNLDKFIKNI